MNKNVFCVVLAAIVVASVIPAVTAQDVGECITFNQTIKLDGPGLKNCSRCQWQCLTDYWCTAASFAGVVYTKAELATLNCGLLDAPYTDTYFTDLKNGTIKGLCVMSDAAGVLIDTQEQSCEECAHQCYYWASCTSYTYNFDLTVPKGTGNSMLSSCPATPFSSPIIIQPDGNARKLLK